MERLPRSCRGELMNHMCGVIWKVAGVHMKSLIPKGGLHYKMVLQEEPPPAPVHEEEEEEDDLDDDDPPEASEDVPPDLDYVSDNELDLQPLHSSKLDRQDLLRLFPEWNGEVAEVEDHAIHIQVKRVEEAPPHHLWRSREKERLHQEDTDTLICQIMMQDLTHILAGTPARLVYDALDPAHRHPHSLHFHSAWESGNLRRVYQVSETDHTQWYYFGVSNMRKDLTYHFRMINMEKPSSEYNQGMRPLFYSEKNSEEGWHRIGDQVCYYRNQYPRHHSIDDHYYTLSFNLSFPHDHDRCYFAPSYPYTATLLKSHLSGFSGLRDRLRRTVLCSTVGGNLCDLLTVTEWGCSSEELERRKYVVMTSRVHPGESQASWMMKGVMDYLLGDSPEAGVLRSHYIFKLVPMLNMDGVVEGNHRCGLTGVDLNRQWLNPDRQVHPTIYYAKHLLLHIRSNLGKEVALFCDLHGHFRKKNIFMFGCQRSGVDKFKERIFPYLLSQADPNFSFESSSYKIPKSKRSCGRVVVGKDMAVTNSYTMEASFSGMDIGPNRGNHMDTTTLENVGKHLCQVLVHYLEPSQGMIQQTHALVKMQEDAPKEEAAPSKKKTKKKKGKATPSTGT
eukprot:TRINITY_DN8972_c0_g1_i1.p1 TRINITY_DN8972_c0_g1~~TRINITY_DN8972_c0_g1_i1.p1  ORF type:complete len:725 (-),score=145.33 TRINITY_DN8972_c0_g1_i1:23-1876(-)